jgi:hypothetical protein
MQNLPSELRDRMLKKQWLLIQQGLSLRSFNRAMREGDSGRVVSSLTYFTVFFQATSQNGYSQETLHLTACLREYWSEGYKKFWMDTCLMNPSGKKKGWLACDAMTEHVVRIVEELFPANISDVALRSL